MINESKFDRTVDIDIIEKSLNFLNKITIDKEILTRTLVKIFVFYLEIDS